MPFDKAQFRPTYSSDEDSLLHSFYIPALRESVRYDRAVGFFSSAMLTYALQGLDSFVAHEGKMRLIIGEDVSEDEYQAILKGHQIREFYQRIEAKWEGVFAECSDELLSHRLKLLSWLVANGSLEIRLAIRRAGMYHEKIGILYDEKGNVIVFQGSANETKNALLPDFNFESISVYPNWKEAVFEEYGIPYLNRFERLWENKANNTIVVSIPSTHYKIIRNAYKNQAKPQPIETDIFDSLLGQRDAGILPTYPKIIGGVPYELRDHQLAALEEWKAKDFRGIMALATGAGKTITAIHAAVAISQKSKLAVIVAVPYQVLADQWCEVFSLFNIEPIRCYRSQASWRSKLESGVANFNLLNEKRFLAAVVVNATLVKHEFQNAISSINPKQLFFIGDECHHHKTEQSKQYLPTAKFRMGLSATPWSKNELEARAILENYYGGIVANYSIDKAIIDEVLVGYRYIMHPVEMEPDESEDYERLTTEINKLIAIKEQGGRINNDDLTMKLMARARLLGSLRNKFVLLSDTLERKRPVPYVLFYCGDGSVETDEQEGAVRDVEHVAAILHKKGWKTSRFTAKETQAERHRILANFKAQVIDAVVAIRVLDEGFDLPACREAYLLASSRNERQFIQRRGRILRRSTGKKEAVIHDFIVLPDRLSRGGIFSELVKKELARAGEFIRVANNRTDCEYAAQKLADSYGISFESVEFEYLEWESQVND